MGFSLLLLIVNITIILKLLFGYCVILEIHCVIMTVIRIYSLRIEERVGSSIEYILYTYHVAGIGNGSRAHVDIVCFVMSHQYWTSL